LLCLQSTIFSPVKFFVFRFKKNYIAHLRADVPLNLIHSFIHWFIELVSVTFVGTFYYCTKIWSSQPPLSLVVPGKWCGLLSCVFFYGPCFVSCHLQTHVAVLFYFYTISIGEWTGWHLHEIEMKDIECKKANSN